VDGLDRLDGLDGLDGLSEARGYSADALLGERLRPNPVLLGAKAQARALPLRSTHRRRAVDLRRPRREVAQNPGLTLTRRLSGPYSAHVRFGPSGYFLRKGTG
jgi:hypothetical protein